MTDPNVLLFRYCEENRPLTTTEFKQIVEKCDSSHEYIDIDGTNALYWAFYYNNKDSNLILKYKVCTIFDTRLTNKNLLYDTLGRCSIDLSNILLDLLNDYSKETKTKILNFVKNDGNTLLTKALLRPYGAFANKLLSFSEFKMLENINFQGDDGASLAIYNGLRGILEKIFSKNFATRIYSDGNNMLMSYVRNFRSDVNEGDIVMFNRILNEYNDETILYRNFDHKNILELVINNDKTFTKTLLKKFPKLLCEKTYNDMTIITRFATSTCWKWDELFEILEEYPCDKYKYNLFDVSFLKTWSDMSDTMFIKLIKYIIKHNVPLINEHKHQMISLFLRTSINFSLEKYAELFLEFINVYKIDIECINDLKSLVASGYNINEFMFYILCLLEKKYVKKAIELLEILPPEIVKCYKYKHITYNSQTILSIAYSKHIYDIILMFAEKYTDYWRQWSTTHNLLCDTSPSDIELLKILKILADKQYIQYCPNDFFSDLTRCTTESIITIINNYVALFGNFNSTCNNGNTYLMYACANDNIEVTLYILSLHDKKIDVGLTNTNKTGLDVFRIAKQHRLDEILAKLLDYEHFRSKMYMNKISKYIPKYNMKKVFLKLISLSVPINLSDIYDKNGNNVAMILCEHDGKNNESKIINMLDKLDITETNNNNDTLLILSSKNELDNLTISLLKRKVDISARNKNNCSALSYISNTKNNILLDEIINCIKLHSSNELLLDLLKEMAKNMNIAGINYVYKEINFGFDKIFDNFEKWLMENHYEKIILKTIIITKKKYEYLKEIDIRPKETENICIICAEEAHNYHIFYPCLHGFKIDEKCICKISKCPFCRTVIEKYSKIFIM